MAELIYNVKNIFSKDAQGCLFDYNAECYHIAAYQRGYKWGSDNNGAVTILLQDLLIAFSKRDVSSKNLDYYLQYITLKKQERKIHLEVIDGQQRLTTLSILLSVFSYILGESNQASGKLDYAVRSNFFDEYIYKKESLALLLTLDWNKKKGLEIDTDTFIDNQDTYYIFHAIKKCYSFLEEFSEIDLLKFYQFVLNHVLIIVNVVENVDSEKTFSNFHSTSVALTESELIKALFVTKYARLKEEHRGKTFREINEQRLLLGKRWDEIENWVNNKYIKSFYFRQSKDPMFGFLNVVANNINNKLVFNEDSTHREMFNFFNIQEIEIMQEKLYNTFWILKDWYNDPILHNRFGYLFFYKKSKFTINNFINEMTASSKETLKNELLKKILDILPLDLEDSNYEGNTDSIHQILLAINLFNTKDKFDFYSYVEENWTLEHIFPQTPEGKKNTLTENDKTYIIELVGDADKLKVEKVLKKKERTPEDKEVYTDALKRSGFIHSIGNLCLLSNVDNILNGCAFYDEKRFKILNRVKSAKFIPPHTIEIFTKSIFNINPGDFTRWNRANIIDHKQIMLNRIIELRQNLEKLVLKS
ncbi:hypothetical protein A5893_09640 [Pedobacter psychrophilus]|uniref:DUF262 domain-containing protein n=1 Tax=Pedobacter psychrophilus TaxID=1826909 RepID=A0A179DFK4_9SPHI|nr:DUF262 domain-containing protein [Pedobacter psychrophilus]OAQ39826.1 hypothetical protein A5893_09640 [Pedobacter psychrophilus]